MRITQTITLEFPGVGERIKEARLNASLSAAEAAKGIGISRNQLVTIESEQAGTTLETIRKIEEFLGVDLGVKFPGDSKRKRGSCDQ